MRFRFRGRLTFSLTSGLGLMTFIACASAPVASSIAPSTLAAATATPAPLATPDPATQQAIQTLLDSETRAWNDHDPAAYEPLLDPDADPAWRQSRLEWIQRAESVPASLRAARIAIKGEWALVIVTVWPNEGAYELAYFRRFDDGAWRLTSPRAEPWGEWQTLRLKHLSLTFLAFDAPYIQAIASQLDSYFLQVAQDFGVPLDDESPSEVGFVPVDFPSPVDDAAFNIIKVKVSYMFTRERDLTEAALDQLGHLLITRVREATGVPEMFPCLAEAFIQWEVAPARGTPSRASLLDSVQTARERWPLAELLDPADTQLCGDGILQRMALVAFITETYGRDRLGAVLRAMFVEHDWEGMVRSALSEEPTHFAQRWEAWIDQR